MTGLRRPTNTGSGATGVVDITLGTTIRGAKRGEGMQRVETISTGWIDRVRAGLGFGNCNHKRSAV
jgi:hypothetical protein